MPQIAEDASSVFLVSRPTGGQTSVDRLLWWSTARSPCSSSGTRSLVGGHLLPCTMSSGLTLPDCFRLDVRTATRRRNDSIIKTKSRFHYCREGRKRTAIHNGDNINVPASNKCRAYLVGKFRHGCPQSCARTNSLRESGTLVDRLPAGPDSSVASCPSGRALGPALSAAVPPQGCMVPSLSLMFFPQPLTEQMPGGTQSTILPCTQLILIPSWTGFRRSHPARPLLSGKR